MATLTGAARVALGLDIPVFFATDDAFAGKQFVLTGKLETMTREVQPIAPKARTY